MVVTPHCLRKEFRRLRTRPDFRQTFSTGYSSLDEIVKLTLGRLAIVTGYPGCGKSELIDAILTNTAIEYSWKSMFFSPENYPIQDHVAKLAEKMVGKWVKHFTDEEEEEVLKRLNLFITWIDSEKEVPTLDQIFDAARERKATLGLECLVIDPWNGVKHQRSIHQREDEYLAEILTQIILFARRHNLLVFIIAHPKTAQKDKGGKFPRCTMSDISGGAMWWNKADYAFICHREDRTKNQIEVEVGKCKQKWMGTTGSRMLDYDRTTGRFKSTGEKDFLLPSDITPPF